MSNYSTLDNYQNTTLKYVEEGYSHQLACGGKPTIKKLKSYSQAPQEDFGAFSISAAVRGGSCPMGTSCCGPKEKIVGVN